MKISELHFRVADNGLFLPVALRLAREAGKVSYWSPCGRSFPVVTDLIGEGFPEIERVNCCFEDLESVDCFVFPDVGMSGLQEMVEAHGIPAWGPRLGDELEINRGLFLKELNNTDLPIPVYEKAKGLSELREMLRDRKDVWVKISRFRGNWETFHWRSWAEDENTLDEKAAKLGPFRERIVFYVFDPIEADIEDGCDSWCIDGQFPSLIVHGVEAKDKAFIGTFQKFDDLPEEVRKVSEEFAPILGERGYRGFFSTEVRITPEGESYFIDPTCRAGSPPSQCMTEMIGNYAEIIWGGANGDLVEPEPAAKFGVQALCNFKRKPDAWAYVNLGYELGRWAKSANCMMDGDVRCLPPDTERNECQDWLVGIGDTMGEAIRHLKHNAGLLPDGASCEYSSLSELLSQIGEAEDKGMEFTEQELPPPEIALKD